MRKEFYNMDQYNGSQIVVLEGLEAVRKRPGMYIGSTGSRGLHHLIWEILDNGIDEHLAGYCSAIDVILRTDGGITIKDNGRGVPIDIHPTKKIPTVRVVYTILHAGGKFDSSVYKVSGGLHGVGASVVNALSSKMIVEIRRDGKIYQDIYENGGHPTTKLENGTLPTVGKCNKSDTGTSITFYPDSSIFETIEFKPEVIKKKLKEIAFLNKNLLINFTDETTNTTAAYQEEAGIKSFVRYLNRDNTVLHEEPIYIEGKSGDIEVEVAFQYTSNYSEQINAYCNRINVVDGGTLVTGFKMALTRIMNQYARELNILKEKDENFDIEKQIKDQIRKAIKTYSKHEFIDYGSSGKLARELQKILMQGQYYLSKNNILNGSLLCMAYIQEVMPVITYADDSNGSIGDAIDSGISLLTDIAVQSPVDLKEKIAVYLNKELQQDLYFDYGDFGYDMTDLYAQLCLDLSKIDDFLHFADVAIHKARLDRYDYRSSFFIQIKASILQKANRTDEAQHLMEQQIHLPKQI